MSDVAKDGQILVSQRMHADLGERVVTESIGEFPLRGFREPVEVFSALDLI